MGVVPAGTSGAAETASAKELACTQHHFHHPNMHPGALHPSASPCSQAGRAPAPLAPPPLAPPQTSLLCGAAECTQWNRRRQRLPQPPPPGCIAAPACMIESSSEAEARHCEEGCLQSPTRLPAAETRAAAANTNTQRGSICAAARLGGLAAACLSTDHHHVMLAQRSSQRLPDLSHWQPAVVVGRGVREERRHLIPPKQNATQGMRSNHELAGCLHPCSAAAANADPCSGTNLPRTVCQPAPPLR